jgi:hypothetical protein
MNNQSPEITAALAATEAFVDVLRAEELFYWAKRFERIAINLQAGQAAEAIYSFSNTTYAGLGSLSDIFAKDEKAFNSAWGECTRALSKLQRLAIHTS